MPDEFLKYYAYVMAAPTALRAKALWQYMEAKRIELLDTLERELEKIGSEICDCTENYCATYPKIVSLIKKSKR